MKIFIYFDSLQVCRKCYTFMYYCIHRIHFFFFLFRLSRMHACNVVVLIHFFLLLLFFAFNEYVEIALNVSLKWQKREKETVSLLRYLSTLEHAIQTNYAALIFFALFVCFFQFILLLLRYLFDILGCFFSIFVT